LKPKKFVSAMENKQFGAAIAPIREMGVLEQHGDRTQTSRTAWRV